MGASARRVMIAQAKGKVCSDVLAKSFRQKVDKNTLREVAQKVRDAVVAG